MLRAQAEDSAYRAAIDSAFVEFEAGRYAEARTHFLEAHALDPNARVLRALGMVEFELRNYLSATTYLDRALDSEARPLVDAEREEAEALRKRARGYLARYTLSIEPRSAQVLLDGEPIYPTAGEPLALEVGDHVLEVRAKGYAGLRRELRVEGRKDQALSLELQPLVAATPTAAAAAAPVAALAPSIQRTSSARPWLWVGALGLTVGVAVLVGALVGSSNPFEVRAPVTTRQTPPGAVIQLLRAP